MVFFFYDPQHLHMPMSLTHNVSYSMIYYLFSEKRFYGCFMTKIDPCIDSVTFPKVNEKRNLRTFFNKVLLVHLGNVNLNETDI